MKKIKRIKDKRTYIYDAGDIVTSKYKSYNVHPGFDYLQPQEVIKVEDVTEFFELNGIVYQVLWFKSAPDKMQLGELFLPHGKETKRKVAMRIKEAEQMSGGEFKKASEVKGNLFKPSEDLRNKLKDGQK